MLCFFLHQVCFLCRRTILFTQVDCNRFSHLRGGVSFRQFKSGRPKQQNSAIQGWNWPLRLVCWHLLTLSEEEATPTNQNERPEGTSYIPSIAPFSYFGRPDLNCLFAAYQHPMSAGQTRPDIHKTTTEAHHSIASLG